MKKFRTYPTINDRIFKSINYIGDTKFKFKNKSQNTEDHINIIADEDVIEFRDKDRRWFYKQNDLIIEIEIKFETKSLFNKLGIAEENSELGVAISWSSKKSMIRGIEDVGSFSKHNEIFERTGKLYFGKDQIRESLNYEVIIYLKKPVIKSGGFSIFADVPGTVLGVLETRRLDFTGSGSTFPIVNVRDEKYPLWKLEIKSDEPTDLVEDSIELVLNESHKKYELFEQGETFNESFVQEVMINVVFQLLLFEEKEKFYDEEYEEGTLGALINYYKRVYSIKDYEDATELYASISKEIRK